MPWMAGGGMTSAVPSGMSLTRALRALVEPEQILAFAALVPVLEDDVGDAGVREAGAVVEGGEAGDGDDLLDAGLLLDAQGDVVERARGALQRGALGQLHDDEEVALVLDGQEAGRHAAQAPHGKSDERRRR